MYGRILSGAECFQLNYQLRQDFFNVVPVMLCHVTRELLMVGCSKFACA